MGLAEQSRSEQRILQSKVPPREDPAAFEAELSPSCSRLDCDRLDLLAIHGINRPEHLEQTLRPGGCMDVVRRWQRWVASVMWVFSTHGPTDLIATSCDSRERLITSTCTGITSDRTTTRLLTKRSDRTWGCSSSVPPTREAISTPHPSVCWSCVPLHPIVFNDLFCLSDPRVHTISVGPHDRRISICTSRLWRAGPGRRAD